jgi:hypothetical protein
MRNEFGCQPGRIAQGIGTEAQGVACAAGCGDGVGRIEAVIDHA